MEEDALAQAKEELEALREQQKAWEAGQKAREMERDCEQRDHEARLKELHRQKEELIRRQQRQQQRQQQKHKQRRSKSPCRRIFSKQVRCDRYARLVKTKRQPFYHCCLCVSEGKRDNYDQCTSCGSRCRDSRHGPMSLKSC